MELNKEIFKLSIMKEGSILPVNQGADEIYLCRSSNGYAVAIPFDDDRILNEPFVGITLLTNYLNFEFFICIWLIQVILKSFLT